MKMRLALIFVVITLSDAYAGSFSAPSRGGFSAPSRGSYSAPSRSYSAPSRSYSAPSPAPRYTAPSRPTPSPTPAPRYSAPARPPAGSKPSPQVEAPRDAQTLPYTQPWAPQGNTVVVHQSSGGSSFWQNLMFWNMMQNNQADPPGMVCRGGGCSKRVCEPVGRVTQ